jgi:hypothetical protein
LWLSDTTEGAPRPGKSTKMCRRSAALHIRLTVSGSVAPAMNRKSTAYEISVSTIRRSSSGSRRDEAITGTSPRSRAKASKLCDSAVKKRLSCRGMIIPTSPDRALRNPRACMLAE